MTGMTSTIVAAVATPAALAAAWLLYNIGDLRDVPSVRPLLRWAGRVLLVAAMLSPPAGAAAFMWVAAQEQERLEQWIVEPMLERIQDMPPAGTAP
jgi:hypothetical protein